MNDQYSHPTVGTRIFCDKQLSYSALTSKKFHGQVFILNNHIHLYLEFPPTISNSMENCSEICVSGPILMSGNPFMFLKKPISMAQFAL